MNGEPIERDGLTDQDAQTCLRILGQSCPRNEERLQRMRAAGLPAPQAEEHLEANKQIAAGILRVYFPDKMG